MLPVARHALRFVLLVGTYLLGAYIALWFVEGDEQITLIWPPTGVAYAALLLYGLRWWPFIAVSVLLTHLLLAPVPASFVPYSVAANTVGGLVGAAFVQRFHRLSAERYAISDGFALLLGGVFMLLASAPISTLGLIQSGMIASADALPAALRWAMGDLFGIITVTPAVLLVGRRRYLRSSGDSQLDYGGHAEKAAWLACLALSLLALGWIGRFSPAYALGLASVPISLLLWSALRFEPLFTALANAVCAMLVATAASLGLGGLVAPTGLGDVTLLIAFLCVLALTPQIVSIAAHRSRVIAQRLLQRARTDALTGLLNRIGFEEEVRKHLQAEGGEAMALVHLDLDQFKLINDILSHQVGDELICAVAGALRTRIGPLDRLARTGGDEFDVLLRHCPPQEAEARVQRLRDAVAEIRVGADAHVASVTTSAGLACFVAGEAEFPQLLARADTACFTAKERGGNRTESATPERGAGVERSSDAMRWALRLNQALEQDRFVLFCQSICALAPGRRASASFRDPAAPARCRQRRPADPGHVHPRGRTIRPGHAAGFLRRGPHPRLVRAPPGRGAACRAVRHQPVRRLARRRTLPRLPAATHQAQHPVAREAVLRAHRNQRAARHGPRPALHPGGARARLQVRARRLRHRLLLVRISPISRRRLFQDRRQLRARDRNLVAGAGDRALDRRHRPHHRQADDRRMRRNRIDPAPPDRTGCRPRTRLRRGRTRPDRAVLRSGAKRAGTGKRLSGAPAIDLCVNC
jgi:diguanylate cyclase (GGDEF)-like protein